MSSFKSIRIVDNFYQTSSFFPMPTILIGTLNPDGSTNLGAYSLCFPYYVAGKDYYAMILSARNSSNTAQNLLRTKQCSLNFLPHSRKFFKETVRLGFPGETSAEKMAKCKFTLEAGQASGTRPSIVKEAFQVFECSWDDSLEDAYLDQAGLLEGYPAPYRNFNGITSKMGVHFILKIDNILLKQRFYNTIINGVRSWGFPNVPVDYGYRDSTNFWYTKFRLPIAMKIPVGKEADLSGVMYAANRMDPAIQFTPEACKTLVRVPRVFLKVALQGCVDWAKANNVTLIDEQHMKIINDKRSQEKR